MKEETTHLSVTFHYFTPYLTTQPINSEATSKKLLKSKPSAGRAAQPLPSAAAATVKNERLTCLSALRPKMNTPSRFQTV